MHIKMFQFQPYPLLSADVGILYRGSWKPDILQQVLRSLWSMTDVTQFVLFVVLIYHIFK